MISTWRRRRAARRTTTSKQRKEGESGDIEVEVTVPNHFRCPISLDLMKDPVTMSTGITYDRENIERWINGAAGNITCPITNQKLRSVDPIPNHTIRKMIQDWCVENTRFGIERIPTPRIPISSEKVLEIQSKITGSCTRGDPIGCQNLVARVKTALKESERNKRCIVTNGTATVLSKAFQDFSRTDFQENVGVLDEILSSLTLMFPLDAESRSNLEKIPSISCMVWFLQWGNLSMRRNSVLVLNELVSNSDQRSSKLLQETEGAIEALFKLIKQPICPTVTKASLVIIYNMITSSSDNDKIRTKFVQMGLVQLLLEMLVEAEKSICEKAVGVLDGTFGCEEGREAAYNHALTVPILVKKIHRVSELATEFSVSCLWKLCKNGKNGAGVLVEALHASAFQKLLLLLQIGCGDLTKEKASELLKMLNVHRERVECIDSMDFKDLKRPF